MTKITGSGSISQRHGSADPDPPQNFMDPEHWHKVLLAAASDYFAAMFTGSMVEAEMETVELQGLEFSALQLLVDYCYSGENEK